MKHIALLACAAACLSVLSGCNDADVASQNLSKAADNFEINRRVVFYNGITGDYMLSIEGLCSLGNADKVREVTITCKTGPNSYKKHFLGLSDNVTYFVEQIDGADVSAYHYKVIFKPSVIVPDISVK
ncbi:beta-sandwich lipoprotein [Paraburkholderia aspalathi]